MAASGDCRRLIINMPPRHMKSLLITVCFPVWVWLQKPETRWLFSSYSQELSTNHSLKRRRIIRSDWYQERWSERFTLRGDQDRKTEFENNHQGVFTATSSTGTVGGKGGDFIVIDDPQNPEKGESTADRHTANEHVKYMCTRMDNPKTSRLILVMQRIHFEDATETLVNYSKVLAQHNENMQDYSLISLDSMATKKTIVSFPKSVEGTNGSAAAKKIIRDPGDLLWPERFGKEELLAIQESLGSYRFAAQYQQMPSPEGGGLVKREWWKFYRELPNKITKIAWFWDTAIKVKNIHDYSVGICIGVGEDGFYALDLIRKRLIYPDLKSEVQLAFHSSDAQFVVVEDKASGQQLVQDLGREGRLPVLPFKPEGDKVQRLSLVSPLIEAGKFFLPADAPWVRQYLEEFSQFPNAAHDDCVDATVMGLTHLHLQKKSGSFSKLNPSKPMGTMAGSLGGGRPKW